MDEPPIGWTTEATVTRVIDGDTLDVEVRRRLTVRLLDCWAPETRTRDAQTKLAGTKSRVHLTELAPVGQPVVVHIPGDIDVREAFTFGRVLGRVFVGGVDLSEAQIASGNAAAEKQA